MAKKKKVKKGFSCWHAHDYSTIELNGERYLEIVKPEPWPEDDPDEIKEYEETEKKVEQVVEILNKNV